MKSVANPILAGLIVVVIQFVLLDTPLYERFPALDIPMHFLGGLIAGWLFAILCRRFAPGASRFGLFLFIVGGAAFLGVLWEFFEWSVETYAHIPFMGDLNDTLADLLMDLLGSAATAIFLAIKDILSLGRKSTVSHEAIS